MHVVRAKRFFFLCVPKTASRSISEWLVDCYGAVRNGPYHQALRPPDLYRKQWPIIAGTRHPLDRLISLFYVPMLQYICEPDFDAFVYRLVKNKWLNSTKLTWPLEKPLTERRRRNISLKLKWQFLPVTLFVRKILHNRESIRYWIRMEAIKESLRKIPKLHDEASSFRQEIGRGIRRSFSQYYADKKTLHRALCWAESDLGAFGYDPTLADAERCAIAAGVSM